MNAFCLKIIAVITMIIDHVGVAFRLSLNFSVIGRMAYPIFVFLIADGFRYTKSKEKFLIRLFIFAIISEPVFDLAFGRSINFFADTNIFYTLFLGGAAIYVCEKLYNYIIGNRGDGRTLFESTFGDDYLITIISSIPLIFFMFLADFLGTDYAGHGVLIIYLLYIITDKYARFTVLIILSQWQHSGTYQAILQGNIMHIPTAFLLMIPATILPCILLMFYNNKRGPSLKWLFYAVYPLHLFVIAMLVLYV